MIKVEIFAVAPYHNLQEMQDNLNAEFVKIDEKYKGKGYTVEQDSFDGLEIILVTIQE